MKFLNNAVAVIFIMLELVGWITVGGIALICAPFVIGMVVLGAHLFEPDMEDY